MYKIYVEGTRGPIGMFLSNQCPARKDVIAFRGREYAVQRVIWCVDDPKDDVWDNSCTNATIQVMPLD